MIFTSSDIVLLTSREELTQFKDHWEKLYDETIDTSPYLCYDWIHSILKYFGSEEQRLYIAIVLRKSRVLAIAPLKLVKFRFGLKTFKAIQFFGDGWPPQNNIITLEQEDHYKILLEIIDNLSSQDNTIKLCIFKKMPFNLLPTEHTKTKKIKNHHLDALHFKTGRSVLITLPDSWDHYYKSLSKSHRKSINRRINSMKRDFDLALYHYGIKSKLKIDLNKLIHDALTISNKSWQGNTSQGRSISDPDTAPFFQEISVNLAKKQMLDLSVLYANEQPVSFIWGAARWPFSTILKLGFDHDYQQYSPGTVHLAKHINDSIEQGVKAIDFGHEFYDYKKRWSKQHIDLYTLYLFTKSFESSLLRYGLILKNYLKTHTNYSQ